MGTRHLIGVVTDGELKVAQYGQWDGYPEGQGADVLKFLRDADLASFGEKVRALRWGSDADVAAAYKEIGADESGWITLEQADLLNKKYPALSRDTGSDILSLINDGKVDFVVDHSRFALDSLFCEWAYIIDLDQHQLEVYKGFQKDVPTEGRWAGQRDGDSEYAAIERVNVWGLSDLPTNEEFLEELSEEDEE